MNINPSRGQLLIISAPSGAGKDVPYQSACRAPTIGLKYRYRTQPDPQRPGEKEGKNYFFVSETTFLSSYEKTARSLNGPRCLATTTARASLSWRHVLHEGADVVLEIDWQGAQQVRKLVPDSAWAFILPPSIDSLKARLHSRGQDNDDTIEVRMGRSAGRNVSLGGSRLSDYQRQL